MPRYYFDSRDNFIEDDVGMTFANLELCKREAARALAEIARDITPGSERRKLVIEVRDQDNKPLVRTVLIFELQSLTKG